VQEAPGFVNYGSGLDLVSPESSVRAFILSATQGKKLICHQGGGVKQSHGSVAVSPFFIGFF
jgi:fructose-1,6-bisphosphatase